MRIALGQVDTTVGDLDGNVDLLTAWASRATEAGADVVVFPELAITGYPPEDLVLRPAFVDDNLTALDALARADRGRLRGRRRVRRPDATPASTTPPRCSATARSIARYHKIKLPNYGVFDEARTSRRATRRARCGSAASELGLSVCEDAWTPGPPFDDVRRTRRRRSSSTSTARRSTAARPTSASRSAATARSRPARGSST